MTNREAYVTAKALCDSGTKDVTIIYLDGEYEVTLPGGLESFLTDGWVIVEVLNGEK